MSHIEECESIATEDRPQVSGGDGAEPIGVVPSGYFRYKRWLDSGVAAVLLLPGAVMIAVLVVLVRLLSPGAALFRQVRVGYRGRLFTMYKIRTMRVDAEKHSGPMWCTVGDPRITRLGAVLRKLHLDELPQLINVLRGDMSLIGPRPERPEFVKVLADMIPGYMDRLAIPPGVTGLAQINLPPDTDLESVRRKLVLDLEYAREASLFLDLRMMLCTGVRMFGLPGVLVMHLFGLRRQLPVDGTEAAGRPISEVVQSSRPQDATPTTLNADQAAAPSPPLADHGQRNGTAIASASKARRAKAPRRPR